MNGFSIDLGPYKGREFVEWEKYHSSNSHTTSIKQFQYGELRTKHRWEKGSFHLKVFEFPLASSLLEVEQGVLSPGAETAFQACVGAGTWQLLALFCCFPWLCKDTTHCQINLQFLPYPAFSSWSSWSCALMAGCLWSTDLIVLEELEQRNIAVRARCSQKKMLLSLVLKARLRVNLALCSLRCVMGLPTALAPELTTLLVLCFLASVSNAQVTPLTYMFMVSLVNRRAKSGIWALWELVCLSSLLVYLIDVLCLSWHPILYTTSFPSLSNQLNISITPLSMTTVWCALNYFLANKEAKIRQLNIWLG